MHAHPLACAASGGRKQYETITVRRGLIDLMQVFELVKNSLRAVNDKYQDSDDLPPSIRVVVAEGGEDVTIKVCRNLGFHH